jgi:hypothetical protein
LLVHRALHSLGGKFSVRLWNIMPVLFIPRSLKSM